MCSEFIQRMENYQGDLTDIIRGSGGSAGSNTTSTYAAALPEWRIPSNPMNYSSSGFEERLDDFGDPFSTMQDPLLHEKSSEFFASPSNNTTNIPNNTSLGGGNNMFSSMLQISPTVKPPVSGCGSPVVAAVSPRLRTMTSMLLSNSPVSASSKGCLVENVGLQISSPRNTGFKRRKSQAKKVVCIPAPAPANSRQSGEVVPSDLWAWRKYGQKPIKGSPYPRGYYRCSSTKGCSARKQVERSRTDPNMLVITYTSEHNHPWPTQRNALAGSTRSQPVKTNSSPKISSSSASQPQAANSARENNGSDHVSLDHQHVKEEIEDVQKKVEMEDLEFPALPVSNQSEDFFAELGEIEGDPLEDYLFKQGFSGDDDGQGNNKSPYPFSFYNI